MKPCRANTARPSADSRKRRNPSACPCEDAVSRATGYRIGGWLPTGNTPATRTLAVAARFRPLAPLAICAKGIEATTRALPIEIMAELHPGVPAAVLTGPNFAHEVAAGLPAAAVVAAADAGLRAALMRLLGTPSFRLYGNDDPVGAQLRFTDRHRVLPTKSFH